MRIRDGENDDISKSNADEMFAFSQIIASGQNPLEVAAKLEKEAKKEEAKPKNVLDDDSAVAAYAQFMGDGGSLIPDPKEIEE